MKHRLLILAITILATLPTHAQRLSPSSIIYTYRQAPVLQLDHSELPQRSITVNPSTRPQAKATGAAFYTQTFPSIPTGWTITTDPGSINGWRWANAAPVGA